MRNLLLAKALYHSKDMIQNRRDLKNAFIGQSNLANFIENLKSLELAHTFIAVLYKQER